MALAREEQVGEAPGFGLGAWEAAHACARGPFLFSAGNLAGPGKCAVREVTRVDLRSAALVLLMLAAYVLGYLVGETNGRDLAVGLGVGAIAGALAAGVLWPFLARAFRAVRRRALLHMANRLLGVTERTHAVAERLLATAGDGRSPALTAVDRPGPNREAPQREGPDRQVLHREAPDRDSPAAVGAVSGPAGTEMPRALVAAARRRAEELAGH